jgi:hypothetical protein
MLQFTEMPRAWQYPRWRRILMQATLWLILGCAIGSAELVTRQRLDSIRINLTHAFSSGRLHIRVPAGWVLIRSEDESLNLIGPPAGDSDERPDLTANIHQLIQRMSPAEFLASSGLLRGTYVAGDNDDPDGQSPDSPNSAKPAGSLEEITVAGTPGVMLRVFRVQRSEMTREVREELIAVGVLRSNLAIVLQMHVPRSPDDDAAEELLRAVAAEITVSDSNRTPPL